MKLLETLLVAVAIAAPLTALARSPAVSAVDQRQANQERRIDQGVQSGALTEREAARLEHGQERVQRIEDKAKADGKLTRAERVRLHQAQDEQSQRIYRQKRDRQHDFNHDGRIDRPARAVR